MRHLSEGALRRMQDELLAIGATEKAHHVACLACQARSAEMAADARSAGEMLALPDLRLSPELALTRLRRAIEATESARPITRRERLLARLSLEWPKAARPTAVLLFAAVLLGLASASGLAQNLFKIFEPKHFQPVTVSPSDLNRAGLLLDYGKLTWTAGPPTLRPVDGAAAATAETGLAVLTPSALPSGVPSKVSYAVAPHSTASYTLNAADLRSSAQKARATVSPMPASLDGSTLYLDAGPTLMELYGGTVPTASGTGAEPPVLVIVETRTPTISSTGATTRQLEDYLLAQPGVPPELAAQLRAIRDPSATLPVPIPAGLASTRQVKVRGVDGLLVDAGFVSGVVWQDKGVIYAVGGQLTPDQVLSIANSLH